MLNKYTVILYKYTTDTIKVKEVKARLLRDGRYKLKSGKKVAIDEIAKKEPHTCYKLQNIEWHDYIKGAEKELGKLEEAIKKLDSAEKPVKEPKKKPDETHNDTSDYTDNMQVMINGHKLSKQELSDIGFTPYAINDMFTNNRIYTNDVIENALDKVTKVKESTQNLLDSLDYEPKRFDGNGVYLSGSGIQTIKADNINNSVISGSGIKELHCSGNFGNVRVGGSGIATIYADGHIIEYTGHILSIDDQTISTHIPAGSVLSFINGKLYLNHKIVYQTEE